MSYTQKEVEQIVANAVNNYGGNLKDTVTELGEGIEVFKAQYAAKLDEFETILGRGSFGGSSWSSGGTNLSAKEHKEKFLAWLRQGSDPDGLKSLEIQASLSTLDDTEGGFLVAEEMAKEIERLATDSVAMRRLATVVNSKGEYKRPLSKGGAGGGWVSEKGARDETDAPDLTLFSPPMQEIYAMPAVTQKLLDMSDFDVEAWLTEEVSSVFVETEGTGFITGNGVSQVKGIIDDSKMIDNDSWEYGKTGYIVGGAASTFSDADKLFDLQHSLKPVYRQNGTFLMNDSTLAVIRKMKDGEGNYLWRPGLEAGSPDVLLGKPVEIDDNMDDIGAGKYPVAFGDFKKAYRIIDHVNGIRVLRDPYTSKGFVRFYTIKRLAAGISNYQAIKFLKIATS
ncbi:MAG: phage major capsid protein [Deltaproteobacteria bacterium]|nr:phage major capsid protein [Deltaproteobacteria bacterium]